MRRILAAVLSLVFLFPFPAPASAAQICYSGNMVPRHLWVADTSQYDTGGLYFTGAKATATVRQVPVCPAVAGNNGGSWVLPMNVEGSSGQVLQLGFGQWGTWGSMDFVYAVGTPGDPPNAIRWPGTLTPIEGRSYTFSFERLLVSGTWWAKLSIKDLAAGETEWMWVDYYGAYNAFWAGFEAWNYGDGFGVEQGVTPRQAIRGLARLTGGSSTWTSIDLATKKVMGNGSYYGSGCQFLDHTSCAYIEDYGSSKALSSYMY